MYPRIVSALFYMFFTCVIFNPEVNGFTIYFYLFIPFLDPGFSRFLASTVRRWSVPLLVAVLLSLTGSPSVAVRVISLAICIGYILYTMDRRINYLHHWMAINVAFALVQFTLYYVDKGLAWQLGPTQLAKTIWGPYATKTFTNFFEIFYFARVSGFSREAGFFSSLLLSSLVLYLFTEKVNKKMVFIYFFGLFIGFSKSSMLLFIFAALYPFRHKLRAVHPLVILVAFIGSVSLMAIYLADHGFFGSETFAHRFGGYPFMYDARLEHLIFGITPADVLAHYKYLPYIRMVEPEALAGVPFAGLPASVADMGLFSALLLFGVVAFTASDGFVMALLLLITSTVSITSVTSFVPIAYVVLYWPRFSAYRAQRMQQQLAEEQQLPRNPLNRFRRAGRQAALSRT
ncbi:hypothetical protein AWB81_02680 [Caballeronia arationis]|uniref:Uncharacterized protein n=1 Tax=Caballeronia arationis TaxID=1777142 RepID=A0A7Z7IEI3_9BURK|nr:hypothetical protein [Caballeronia arationis]SAK66380.1 hypothetical protein AWB81_02680 [Caballeronia arationis]SOE88673.1 hypothetical protein SAMN05446927_7294 [Caballeronia arationis]